MKMVVLITTTTGHFKIDNVDPLLVLFYWIEIEMIIPYNFFDSRS